MVTTIVWSVNFDITLRAILSYSCCQKWILVSSSLVTVLTRIPIFLIRDALLDTHFLLSVSPGSASSSHLPPDSCLSEGGISGSSSLISSLKTSSSCYCSSQVSLKSSSPDNNEIPQVLCLLALLCINPSFCFFPKWVFCSWFVIFLFSALGELEVPCLRFFQV